MGNDGIASVDDACIVTSFVKHTHINTENICQINSTAHAAFIRADHHQMFTVYLDIADVGEQCFDELVSRLYGFKT